MRSITRRRLRDAFGTAALIPILAAGLVTFSGASLAADITQSDSDLVPCGTYDAKNLDARPIPNSIGGPGLLELDREGRFQDVAEVVQRARGFAGILVQHGEGNTGPGQTDLREEADRGVS